MKPVLALCAGVLVLGAALTLGRAGAQSMPMIPAGPQLSTFGMVGLADGQTARLNALGLPMGGPIIAGASCEVTFTFYGEDGKSLKSATIPVTQGAAVHFDLQRADIDADTDRREIRGTVRSVLSTPAASPLNLSCSVMPTLEIFDTLTGKTTVVLETPRALPTVLPL